MPNKRNWCQAQRGLVLPDSGKQMQVNSDIATSRYVTNRFTTGRYTATIQLGNLDRIVWNGSPCVFSSLLWEVVHTGFNFSNCPTTPTWDCVERASHNTLELWKINASQYFGWRHYSQAATWLSERHRRYRYDLPLFPSPHAESHTTTSCDQPSVMSLEFTDYHNWRSSLAFKF